MGRARKFVNKDTCEDEYTHEVCLPKTPVVCKHYWSMTPVYMTFLASFVFALISYAAFATSVGSGISALTGAPLITAFIITMIQGIAAMAIVSRFGLFGGYFNIANILGEFLFGSGVGDAWQLLWLVLASTAGYVLANFALLPIFPEADLENGRVAFAAGTTLLAGFFAELLGATILALFVHTPARTVDASLSVWGAVTGAILLAFPKTGGGLNVHIWAGKVVYLMIFNGSTSFFDASEFVAYVFGPIVGFVAAGYLNQMFIRERRVKFVSKDEEDVAFSYGE